MNVLPGCRLTTGAKGGCRVVGAFLLAIVVALQLSGQIITSSIVGQVLDSSGAPVPDAHITVRNELTGVLVEASTDLGGMYSVPNLVAGRYGVRVDKTGFETSTTSGIQVQSSQSVRINVALVVGSVQQNVSVVGSAPLVNTESQTIATAFTSRQMSELPLSTQSVGPLLNLAAGAVPTNSQFPRTSGGTTWGSHNFNLNGVTVEDPGNGTGAYTGGSVPFISLPPVESMQELSVDSVNMTAEYRSVAAVTMVTKQGTNQFHGELYEFLQNSYLNANLLTLNANGQPKPPAKLNQFGGNIGGPIRRNKAWFFFDYGGYRQRVYSPVQLTFPSLAMRQGDFSSLCSRFVSGVCAAGAGTQLYNPFAGQPFLNNIIPQAMIAPQAATLLKYLPAPTVANTLGLPNGAPNYTTVVRVPLDLNNYVTRIDYQISTSDAVSGVFTRAATGAWGGFLGYPATYGNGGNFGTRDTQISATETHTFNPATVNDLRLSWFDHGVIRQGQNTDFNPASLFPQLTPGENRGLPTMNISGYTGMFHDYGNAFYTPSYNLEITDNFTHVRGAHTIKAGIDETGYKIFRPNPFGSLGSFSFTGQWTGNQGWPGQPTSQGNAFADFLLGVANTSTTSPPGIDNEGYDRDWEFYVQDSWQATSNLTLNFGVRYMYQTPWKVRDSLQSFFDFNNGKLMLPQNGSTPVLPTGGNAALFAAYPYETTAAAGLPTSYYKPDKNNFAPRFGFAYRPQFIPHSVLRGGYGIYYNFNPYYAGQWEPSLNPPFGSGSGATTGAINYSTNLRGHPTAPFLPDLTFANPFPASQAGAPAVSHPNVYAPERNMVNAEIQQWNLTLERQFGSSWMSRASYVGSKSDHLPWVDGDINQPLTQIPNVPIQNQRPFQPWNSVLATRDGGIARFNQLQLEAKKRFDQGLSFQAEYQWTRSLDDVPNPRGNPQQWQYPWLDYGNSDGIPRHILVFNYVWELPVGRGRPWLNQLPRAAEFLIGGWQLSGVTTYAGGTPFSVTFSVPSSVVGWWGGRANAVSGVPLYAGQQSGSHNIIQGVQWFNPAAFAPPAPWTWGDAGRNTVWGPGMWDWDISALKNFSVTERIRVQVRGDFFDAFNHFNLGAPNSTIADTRDGGVVNPTTGRIYGGSGNRYIQLGARISF